MSEKNDAIVANPPFFEVLFVVKCVNDSFLDSYTDFNLHYFVAAKMLRYRGHLLRNSLNIHDIFVCLCLLNLFCFCCEYVQYFLIIHRANIHIHI